MSYEPVIIRGPHTRALLSEVAPFYPRAPWIGGDLQTLRNQFVRPAPIRASLSQRLHIPLSSKTVGSLSAIYNAPQKNCADTIILLVHGLGGCEDSKYMLDSAAGLLERGYEVIRLNLRGAGPSAKTSIGPYHAGLTSDLRDVLNFLAEKKPGKSVMAMGFSLGGHLLLRLAGEGDTPENLTALMTVCAPLSLIATQHQIAARRNHVYQKALLRWMMRDAQQWLRDGDARRDHLYRLQSVRDFDDAIVAPHHGFKGAEDYYYHASMQRVANQIHIPVLALHSMDDPWIPQQSYYETDWPKNSHIHVVLTPYGGHVGFHGKGLKRPWYIGLADCFFTSFL